MNDKLKMYVVVRNDIIASVGKLMIHAMHSVSTLMFKNGNSQRIKDWMLYGYQTKIILSIKNLDSLVNLYESIPVKLGDDFPRAMVEDAGFYELRKGIIVCIAVGPVNEEEKIKLGLNELGLFKR